MTLRYSSISAPLEAGTSVLDAHHLPAQLTPALEHISARLAGKAVHLTLVLIRREYQLPGGAEPLSCPTSGRSFSWKRFVPSRSDAAEGPTLRALSVTPAAATADYLDLGGAAGVRFLHAPDLSVRGRATQRAVFAKAARRFNTGSWVLSPAMSPSTCGLPGQLFHDSLVQNEVLFSSDGLTLVSLHRRYSLKSALASYALTRSPLRLENAVDELRRCILAGNGAHVTRSDLLRSYDWLRVDAEAVADLEDKYRLMYGELDGAAEEDLETPSDVVDDEHGHGEGNEEPFLSPEQIGLAVTKSPVPTLKIDTDFDASEPEVAKSQWDHDEDSAVEPGSLHATPSVEVTRWTDCIFGDGLSRMARPPATPNAYDDISPVTRGEWGFLVMDGAFQSRRTAAVETC